MAQVWLAKPESGAFARPVAIKLVLPELAADAEYSRMFIDEAMAASAIHHPNVCRIEELGREGDLLFMVLEWVPGFSLSAVMQVDNRVEALRHEIAARIIADSCAGLHAAHEAVGPDGEPLGIVHRDVSPPNILISLHGTVKVSDFGIAKARFQLHSRTRTGELKGKFAYVSPERLRGRPVDRRADIYALGCVLYLATLGQRPFGTGKEALPKIARGEYKRPSEVRSDYPQALEAIITRALAADPEKRFPTALSMQLELEQWLVTAAHPTTSTDIAAVFRERVGPVALKALDLLMNASRTLPQELVHRLLPGPDTTPTSTTGVTLASPESIARIQLVRAAEADAPTVRVSAPDFEAPALAQARGGDRPNGPAASEQQPETPRPRNVRRKLAAFMLLFLVMFGVAGYEWYARIHAPHHGQGSGDGRLGAVEG